MYDAFVSRCSNPAAVASENYWLFWPGHGKDRERALYSLLHAAALSVRRKRHHRETVPVETGKVGVPPPSLLLHMPALLDRHFAVKQESKITRNFN